MIGALVRFVLLRVLGRWFVPFMLAAEAYRFWKGQREAEPRRTPARGPGWESRPGTRELVERARRRGSAPTAMHRRRPPRR